MYTYCKLNFPQMGEMSCGHIIGLSAVVVYLSLSKADWTELVVERSRMWSVGREPVHLKVGGWSCDTIMTIM